MWPTKGTELMILVSLEFIYLSLNSIWVLAEVLDSVALGN